MRGAFRPRPLRRDLVKGPSLQLIFPTSTTSWKASPEFHIALRLLIAELRVASIFPSFFHYSLRHPSREFGPDTLLKPPTSSLLRTFCLTESRDLLWKLRNPAAPSSSQPLPRDPKWPIFESLVHAARKQSQKSLGFNVALETRFGTFLLVPGNHCDHHPEILCGGSPEARRGERPEMRCRDFRKRAAEAKRTRVFIYP